MTLRLIGTTSVLAACQARDTAWHHATRTADFMRQVRSTV